MRIVISEFISLDGVVQAPGGAEVVPVGEAVQEAGGEQVARACRIDRLHRIAAVLQQMGERFPRGRVILDHVDIRVSDRDASQRFYETVNAPFVAVVRSTV